MRHDQLLTHSSTCRKSSLGRRHKWRCWIIEDFLQPFAFTDSEWGACDHWPQTLALLDSMVRQRLQITGIQAADIANQWPATMSSFSLHSFTAPLDSWRRGGQKVHAAKHQTLTLSVQVPILRSYYVWRNFQAPFRYIVGTSKPKPTCKRTFGSCMLRTGRLCAQLH